MYVSLQTRTATAMARRLADQAAEGQREAAQRAADTAVRLLAQLKEAGAPRDKVEDIRFILLDDIFGTIQGEINRTLDNEGWAADLHQLELGELKP